MADDRALSLAQDSEIGESTINHMIDAIRVFKELGSKKELSALTDRNPKLLYEAEHVLRLGSEEAKQKKCKVYIFDQYLIIASKRLRRENGNNVSVKDGESKLVTASSQSEVVWFGSKNSSTDKGEATSQKSEDSKEMFAGSDYDSEDEIFNEDVELEKLGELEEKEKKESRQYNLKIWIDLKKVRVKSKQSTKTEQFGIFVTYVAKKVVEIAPGQFRHEDIVDQAKIWLENDSESVGKTIVGILQDVMVAHARQKLLDLEAEKKRDEERRKKKSVMSVTTDGGDTDFTSGPESSSNSKKKNSESGTRSVGSASSGTRRKRKYLVDAKKRAAATEAKATLDQAGVAAPRSTVALNKKDLEYRNKVREGKLSLHSKASTDDGAGAEMAEFTLVFKVKQLGFGLSSTTSLGPFVSRVVKDGVAESGGVSLGDRIDAINNVEITKSMPWKKCVEIIRQEQTKGDGNLRITFSRKKKAELQRIQILKQKQEAEAMRLLNAQMDKEEEALANANGEVKPVDSNSEIEEPDLPDSAGLQDAKNYKSIHMVQKQTSRGFKYTMRKGRGSSRLMANRKKKSGGLRPFALKMQVLKEQGSQIKNIKEFKKMRLNKDKLVKLQRDIGTFFSELLEKTDKDKKLKEEFRVISALQEIYKTEERYYSDLIKLKNFHTQLGTIRKDLRCKDLKSGKPFCEHRRVQRLCKLKSSQRAPAITQREVDQIFLNVKSIMKFNFFLLQLLKSKIGEMFEKFQSDQITITEILTEYCKCFTKLTPFLQMYWQYCQRYTIALERQKHLRKTNEHFKAAVITLEKHYKAKLPVLLMKPVQRITRYHLLFQSLKGYTAKFAEKKRKEGMNDLETTQLKEAEALLEKVYKGLLDITNKVNIKVGKAEELEKMLAIHEEIGGPDCVKNLLKPHRRFKTKFMAGYENTTKGTTLPEVGVYLFNDMMVVAKPESVRKNSKISKQVMRFVSFGRTKSKTPGDTDRKRTGGENKKVSAKKKKLSLPSTHNSDKRKRKKNARNSFPRKVSPSAANSRSSSGSRGSVSLVVYSLVSKGTWKHIKVSGTHNRLLEEKDESLQLYGAKIVYQGTRSDGEIETSGFILYFESEEERDELMKNIEECQAAAIARQKQNEANKLKHGGGGKKKKRRFAKKLAARKQQSESLKDATPAQRAKSSMYSKGEFAAKDV